MQPGLKAAFEFDGLLVWRRGARWLFRVLLRRSVLLVMSRLATRLEAMRSRTWHVGRAARLSQRQGLISATMAAGLPTVADLRRAGVITSHEVVAAIDAYHRDPAVGPYRFASGHSLDVAALVNASSAFAMVGQSGQRETTFQTVLAAAIMAARPTAPQRLK